MHPPVIAGQRRLADDQIVLASDTIQPLHTRIGQWVTVDGENGKIHLRVVGEMVSPSIGDLFTNGVGQGGWVYGPAVRKYAQSQPRPSPRAPPPTVFDIFAVRYKVGVSKAAAFASLQRVFGKTVLKQLPAEDVVNLQSVDHLPLLLAGLMALFGVMTLGNTLVISVRRRRRGFAILRAIGFVRPQVAAVVAWQATSFAVVGAPGRLASGDRGGRLAWSEIASWIGSASPAVVPFLAVALIVPGTLVAANAISAWPGWRAARTPPRVGDTKRSKPRRGPTPRGPGRHIVCASRNISSWPSNMTPGAAGATNRPTALSVLRAPANAARRSPRRSQ